MTFTELFEKPAGRYFLSHSIGLRARAADKAMEESYAEPWRRGDGKAWNHWLAAVDGFSAALAPLLGANSGDICPQTNISSALTKIIFSLPERARRKKIVLTEDDFPTVGFVLAQARRAGYELVFLPGGSRLADIDAWAPAFHDDVQLVLATHVFSNTSVRAPAREIAEKARERGVFSVLDAAQSAGAVPVRLNDWKFDFAVGTSVKYLCGGPGAAWLWTERETADRCAPVDVGWFSHEAPFELDIHDFRYADGARRFWGGTPSVAPYAAARAGFETLAKPGVDAISAHDWNLLSRFSSALPQGALLSHARKDECGASALVAVPEAEKASAALSGAGFIHDSRLGAARFSFHLYNSEDDVDALLEALEPWL